MHHEYGLARFGQGYEKSSKITEKKLLTTILHVLCPLYVAEDCRTTNK